MRVEIEAAQAAPAPRARDRAGDFRPARARRIDRFDAGVLALFAVVSLWVVALDLFQVVAHGRVWTGTDGLYLVDQMQYLAWVRDASHHVLASNLFVLRPTAIDYFQPAIAISGALTALGLAPWLALLIWKPIAVGATFIALRQYAARSVAGLWPRRAVLVLGLFFGSFTVVYGSFSVIGDLFPTFLSWGYTFGLLAVAAIAGALVIYDRAAQAARSSWLPGVLGAIASLLHPWHGELLILAVIGGELMLWRRRRPPSLRLAALTVGLTGLPLVYYAILGRADISWKLAQQASHHSFSLLSILVALAPLLPFVIVAYQKPPQTFLAAASRSWPVATLIVYALSATSISGTPLHAFQGVTIPLAVLAVEGAQLLGFSRLRRRVLVGSLAVAAFTLPTTIYTLDYARRVAAPSSGNANFIAADEKRAITYIDHNPAPGGVITRSYLGAVIPGMTGRHTLVGNCLWSEPNCTQRATDAQQLIQGSLAPHEARRMILRSGVRFILSDCTTTADLTRTLGPILRSVRHFGCASVYEIA
jgi:hypothetical protein